MGKLTLNADKSSFIIFKSSKKVIPTISDQIQFLDQKIKRSSHNKFPGITLGENLTWSNHINELINKLKKYISHILQYQRLSI